CDPCQPYKGFRCVRVLTSFLVLTTSGAAVIGASRKFASIVPQRVLSLETEGRKPMRKRDRLLCSLADAMAVNRGHDEVDGRLFYDEGDRFLRVFEVQAGYLPDDWIEVADRFPGILQGIRAV